MNIVEARRESSLERENDIVKGNLINITDFAPEDIDDILLRKRRKGRRNNLSVIDIPHINELQEQVFDGP